MNSAQGYQVGMRQSLPRFVAVGVVVLAIENLLVWSLLQIASEYFVARALATIAALIISFVLNTEYSFARKINIRLFFNYTSGVIFSIFISYVVSLSLFYLILGPEHPLLATNIGAAVAAVTNYLYQHHITYARIG